MSYSNFIIAIERQGLKAMICESEWTQIEVKKRLVFHSFIMYDPDTNNPKYLTLSKKFAELLSHKS